MKPGEWLLAVKPLSERRDAASHRYGAYGIDAAWWATWTPVACSAAGAVLGALLAPSAGMPRPAVSVGGAAAGFVTGVALASVATPMRSLRSCQRRFHELHAAMTALEDTVGRNPDALSVAEFEARRDALFGEYQRAAAACPYASQRAYTATVDDRNRWYYVQEADRYRVFGWGAEHAPKRTDR